jgi:predicted nucleic acid-binding Zn finger protein
MAYQKWNVEMDFVSESGRTYRIKLARRRAYCSCPAWKFQKVDSTKRTCKHIKALRAEMKEAIAA